MTTHAPGPWRVVPRIVRDDRYSQRHTLGVLNQAGSEWIVTDVRERDARLIAAAPDLLAALRDLVKLERDRASGRLQRAEYERRMTAARATIAKAEGKE